MTLKRAFAVLEIKAAGEDGTFTGIATTPTPDRMDDIVLPEGAEFKLPLPLLWQHDSSQPIGQVTEAKVTARGIEVVGKVALGVTAEINRAWALIKAGLVRGLSIGFRGLETQDIPNSWGVIFLRWEWLELSAVTIPAQSEATIQTVKQFDTARPAAPGTASSVAPPGVPGPRKPVNLMPKEGKDMKTIAEQIAALEAKRAAHTARMGEILQKSIDAGETTAAAEQDEFDTLEGEVAQIDADLKRLRTLERIKATEARPANAAVPGTAGAAVAAANGTVPAQVRLLETVEKGINFARIAKVKALAKLQGESPRELARGMYGENSQVFAALQKAAVDAGTSIAGNWAVNLVSTDTTAYADFLQFLRPMTILGRFGVGNVPSLARVPFDTALLSQTAGGAAYWTGEGKPKPLTNFGFGRTTLPPLTVATIAVVTKQLLMRSSIAADTLLRDELARAVAERLDIDFISPAKSASAGVSPASITNGVSAINSSGNDADAVRVDIGAAMQAFIAANNLLTSGVWIMSSSTALALSLMRNPLGQREFPDITMIGGMLEGLPVIASEYLAAVTAGGFAVLVNARDVWLADEDGIAIDMSEQASLQMSDAPGTQDATTGTGTSLVSLWQTNTVGFRAERFINWAKGRATAVQVIDEVNWGATGS